MDVQNCMVWSILHSKTLIEATLVKEQDRQHWRVKVHKPDRRNRKNMKIYEPREEQGVFILVLIFLRDPHSISFGGC